MGGLVGEICIVFVVADLWRRCRGSDLRPWHDVGKSPWSEHAKVAAIQRPDLLDPTVLDEDLRWIRQNVRETAEPI